MIYQRESIRFKRRQFRKLYEGIPVSVGDEYWTVYRRRSIPIISFNAIVNREDPSPRGYDCGERRSENYGDNYSGGILENGLPLFGDGTFEGL